MIIQNGVGDGHTAKVDPSNRLHTRAIVNTEEKHATEHGDSYNINSGVVSLTSAGESGILYFKNNEVRDFHITSIVASFGPSANGVVTDTTLVRVYKNPSAGTLISDATAADINSNRNFSSNQTLTSNTYKGAEAKTITDGSQHSQELVSPGLRAPFPIDELLSNGDSIAISYEPPDSNTAMKCMAQINGHLEDEDSS